MIAIPVKTDNENPALSPLFGKAKWFAYIDQNNTVSIEKNTAEGGRAVVEEMVKRGVTTLIFNHMGGNPFMLLQQAGIECFHGGDKRILIDELLEKFHNKQLTKVDTANMTEYLEQRKHEHANHEHHHH